MVFTIQAPSGTGGHPSPPINKSNYWLLSISAKYFSRPMHLGRLYSHMLGSGKSWMIQVFYGFRHIAHMFWRYMARHISSHFWWIRLINVNCIIAIWKICYNKILYVPESIMSRLVDKLWIVSVSDKGVLTTNARVDERSISALGAGMAYAANSRIHSRSSFNSSS